MILWPHDGTLITREGTFYKLNHFVPVLCIDPFADDTDYSSIELRE